MTQPTQELPSEITAEARTLGDQFHELAKGHDALAVAMAAAAVFVNASRDCGMGASAGHELIDRMFTAKPKDAV